MHQFSVPSWFLDIGSTNFRSDAISSRSLAYGARLAEMSFAGFAEGMIDLSKRLLIAQLVAPDYRLAFFSHLSEQHFSLEVQAGDAYFEPTVRTSEAARNSPFVRTIATTFFFKRRFCWQHLSWRDVLTSSTFVCELNPRVLSSWLALIARRLLGRRTVVWGHAWARKGPAARTEFVRQRMRCLADGVLLYTHQQRRELLEKYPHLHDRCFVAPNSLYRRSEMVAVERGGARDFIYVGRLVGPKKVHVLIDAFAIFSRHHPDSSLHIVGDGDCRQSLETRAKYSGANVSFHGHISDQTQLSELYRQSIASVSPGYVGLSVTQSFSYGVPMIVSKDEPHSPEIEAITEGFNGSFFATDDPASLAAEMERWYAGAEDLQTLSRDIVEQCRGAYSIEMMVTGFMQAVEG